MDGVCLPEQENWCILVQVIDQDKVDSQERNFADQRMFMY